MGTIGQQQYFLPGIQYIYKNFAAVVARAGFTRQGCCADNIGDHTCLIGIKLDLFRDEKIIPGQVDRNTLQGFQPGFAGF